MSGAWRNLTRLSLMRLHCAGLVLLLNAACVSTAATIDGRNTLSPASHPRTLDVEVMRGNPHSVSALRKGRHADIAYPKVFEPGSLQRNNVAGEAFRLRDIQSVVFGEEERVLRLALAALVLRDDTFVSAAKQRALDLADWAPRGTTGFFFHDFAGLSVTWTLALAYDWLHEYLGPEEKRKLLAAIKPRVEDILSPPVKGQPTGWAGLDWGKKLDRWPYDSHGAVTLARLAVICTVLADEDALFDRCAREAVPRYLARPVPWGEKGGYANGTSYAQWDVLYTHFVVWHLLGNALATNLWQREWAMGYLNFIAYFLPPGTPSGLFGDETEKRNPDVWATQAKAYAAVLPSPLADWYARSQFGENPLHLALLLSPKRDWSTIPGALPEGTPQAAHLADIGWVAMHSDLGDRARTSVYFKSSPYGSYNHSHADQNSFVIHAHGRVLAADSGYYDYYGSPHWKDWYKQTRAHNAITFDGGQGQLHDTMAAKGKITRFEHHADYDITTGDATVAYGGALTRAVRSIVYLRPGTVLVHDSLASNTPRTWEWNLHALSRMKDKDARGLEVEQDGLRMCVTLLSAPEGAFSQTDRFTTEPQGNHPRQWHARYATANKSREAGFLALLDVECKVPAPTLESEPQGLSVRLGRSQARFRADGTVEIMP